MFDQDHFVINAAHGLIKKGDKYLVTLRAANKNYMANFWDIPGGTIEFGEKSYDALTREIKEETGLTVEVGNFLYCYDYISETVSSRHQFQMVFECKYLSGEVILNPREHQDYRWVTLEELKDLPKITFLEKLVEFLQKKS